jgi:tetratricopeptide (TPR) repeat protein
MDNNIIILSAFAIFSIIIFDIFIYIYNFMRSIIGEKDLLADQTEERGDADDSPGRTISLFMKELLASAQWKAVPLAPLQAILARLIDAGVPHADIPNRLLLAAEQLGSLRSTLIDWQNEGPGHAQIRSEALALVDSGDFDAASEVLRRGREAGWTFPVATPREESEFYAREAMLDHLQLRYCAAAENYAAAAALAVDAGCSDTWRFLIAQASELREDGREFGRRENLLRAIEIYHRALGLAGRDRSPHDWAATKHHLGHTFLLLAKAGKDTELLREAIDAYLEALEEWTRDRAPLDWAKAQIDLADALQLLGEQESDPERLRQAAEAYRAALGECTKETAPVERARAYNCLGDTLAILGTEEGTSERLKEAVDAYREALDGIDRELTPLDWAATHNNLGKALEALGERDETDTALLHQAVAAYQAALEERCRALAPSSWAAANTNLGNALVAIAERESSSTMLEEAAAAYRAAIAARPTEGAPLDTAKTHINLAYTLGALWNRTRNRHALDEALRAIEAALSLIKETGVQEHIPATEIARETIFAAMGHRKACATAG